MPSSPPTPAPITPSWLRLVERYGLQLSLVVALVLRVGICGYMGFNSPPSKASGGDDVVEFEHMAYTFSQGEGLRLPSGEVTAFRAPGYPLTLGVLYKVFGHRYWLNRVLQIVASMGTVLLVFYLGRRLSDSRLAGVMSAFVVACLPLQFYYVGHFFSEPLGYFLNTLTAWFLVLAMDARPGRRQADWVGLAGIVNGLAILTRPSAILVIPFIPLVMLCCRQYRWRPLIVAGAVFAACSLLPVVPYSLRNYKAFDRFTLVASNGGSTFWGANNDLTARLGKHWGGWVSTSTFKEEKDARVRPLANELDRDKMEFRIGLEWLMHNPGKVPLLMAGKVWNLFSPVPDTPNRVFRLVVGGAEAVFLPFYLAGLVIVMRSRRWRSRWLPVWAMCLKLLAITVIFYGNMRFRGALEPLLAVAAAVAITTPFRKLLEPAGESAQPPEAGASSSALPTQSAK